MYESQQPLGFISGKMHSGSDPARPIDLSAVCSAMTHVASVFESPERRESDPVSVIDCRKRFALSFALSPLCAFITCHDRVTHNLFNSHSLAFII